MDIGLRVFVGQRSANVSASDTSDRTIEEMAIRAVAMAKEAPEDPYVGLADPDQLATDWDIEALELYDPAPEPAPEALQDDAARAEAAGLAVKGVSQVQSAGAGYGATATAAFSRPICAAPKTSAQRQANAFLNAWAHASRPRGPIRYCLTNAFPLP